MPCVRSSRTVTRAGSIASQKLGQPDPDSNFVSDEKSGASQTTQW